MPVIRKKEKKEVGHISTSSLPDIVFMILFFFMVSTSMKETELVVKFKAPQATEIQKLENKSLVSYIYVGPPATAELRAKFGEAPKIQLNNSFSNPEQIGQFIASERDALNEADRNKMTVCLKADKDTRMGVITDIKQELRKAEAYKISYAAGRKVEAQK
jgi:biopolymer transport protein ExbD